MRERGLKLCSVSLLVIVLWSLPVRERGLKPKSNNPACTACEVAPRAGAWIETRIHLITAVTPAGRSPCGSVDWNNNSRRHSNNIGCRSPCGSVDWNCSGVNCSAKQGMSLPVRERGLKQMRPLHNLPSYRILREFVCFRLLSYRSKNWFSPVKKTAY